VFAGLTSTTTTRARAVVGIAPQRRIPAFAPRSFKAWFRRRSQRNEGRPPVVLWPDTFNNHFRPETAAAAVEVLEAAGYRVVVPRQWLCCGRPLYDYGMLDLARRLLRRNLEALRSTIAAGVPVVVLEPSCAAVFRDELLNLFPRDEDARRLSQQTYLLSEFLQRAGYRPPRLQQKAIVQGHCHHRAIMTMDAEEAMLEQLGLDFEILDSGCCGMAGAFGFEKGDRYQMSIKAAERALLPAVRGAARDTLIVADGFSCREQIAQTSDRRALHLAQVIHMAMREGSVGPAGDSPEAAYLAPPSPVDSRASLMAAGLTGAGMALAACVLRRRQKGRRTV
jgi:Fe-S oxidoreductase